MKNIKIIKSDLESVLNEVNPYLPENPIVVEAGSYNGLGTMKMAAFWPQSKIHAFEPVPEIFEMLERNTKNIENIVCYKRALGASSGTGELYLSAHPYKKEKITPASSLLKPKERLEWSQLEFNEIIEVQTVTLDQWADENDIDHVDFMWLDMQGVELDVVKASPKILAKTKAIYCEVEFIEAYEGQPLYGEVKTWFEQQGFSVVAQDFKDQTTWFFGNVLFIRL